MGGGCGGGKVSAFGGGRREERLEESVSQKI